MSGKARHFLGLLKVELEDMGEDIRLMEEISRTRLMNFEITEYVFNENNAFFEIELKAVERLRGLLDAPELLELESIADIDRELRQRISLLLDKFQYPRAVMELVTRKLDKVRQFVLS